MPCKNCSLKPVYTALNNESLCSSHFLKYFERKVCKTIAQHKLIDRKDKIAVALSGGKDSSTLLYVLNKFHQKYRLNELHAILINEGIEGYRNITEKDAKKFCRELGIPLKIVDFRKEFKTSIDKLKKKMNPCSACGVLRRYSLNKAARDIGATKLATGHNLDDEAQSILMNSIKGNLEFSAKLGPKTGVLMHEKFVPRVKPLYFMLEKEVLIYSKLRKLPVTFIECPNAGGSFRNEVGRMLNELESKYPGTKQSILNSFLGMLPLLREKFQKERIRTCRECGEPSVREVCRACQILKI